MIAKKINELLKDRVFVSVATCDFSGRPNVAPKFFLKSEGNFVYLIDYVIGMTYRNLSINKKAAISIMDLDTLHGYQINGSAEIIEGGKDYEVLAKEFSAKEVSLSTKRIIEGLTKGQKHKSFEVAFPDQVVVIKVKIEEAVEIKPSGVLVKEKVC